MSLEFGHISADIGGELDQFQGIAEGTVMHGADLGNDFAMENSRTHLCG